MPGMFCRHNRLTARCPICSKELEAQLPKPPPRVRTPSSRPGRGRTRPRAGARGVVTRRDPRLADDGYRNPLVPGLRATADAERLAAALSSAAARLEPPGPYPAVAAEPDLEDATWLAFLLALAGPDAPELQESLATAKPRWAGADAVELPEARARAAAAYRAWVERSGSQAQAFTGDSAWTPERRFGRLFERLALPGFSRAARFDLLTALGAAGRYPLAPDGLHFVEDDAATLAAKRLLVSGDRLLLDRRARELAEACEVPLGALDRGLAIWGTQGARADLAAEPRPAVRAALGLR